MCKSTLFYTQRHTQKYQMIRIITTHKFTLKKKHKTKKKCKKFHQKYHLIEML